MTFDLCDRIQQANARLKAAKVGITIEMDGGKLRLRTTLPPKSGDGPPRQQRIPLNITATYDGIRQIESEAHSIRRDLNAGRFNWGKYIKSEPLVEQPKLIKDWLEAFENDYFDRREKNQKSLTTWHGDYFQVFKRLPQSELLTDSCLKQLILTTPPDTKNRKRYCTVLGALAKFAGIGFDARNLSGNYSPKKVSPRDIPSDIEIANWHQKLVNPAWKWTYGILATYGLRNHEVFRLDLEQIRNGNQIIHVLDGKTGSRRVWACFPEWFDIFCLSDVHLPEANLKRTNAQLGNNVTHYFVRHHLPFSPYDLRHAWAIRTLEFGLDITLASQQMGHSLKVHSESYHHWISEKHHQRAYDLLMKRCDRPKPPNQAD
jgi:integrase